MFAIYFMFLQHVDILVHIRNTVLYLTSIAIIQSYKECTCIIVIQFYTIFILFYCPRNLTGEQNNYLRCYITANNCSMFIKTVCWHNTKLQGVYMYYAIYTSETFSSIAVIQGYIKCTCIVARWFYKIFTIVSIYIVLV